MWSTKLQRSWDLISLECTGDPDNRISYIKINHKINTYLQFIIKVNRNDVTSLARKFYLAADRNTIHIYPLVNATQSEKIIEFRLDIAEGLAVINRIFNLLSIETTDFRPIQRLLPELMQYTNAGLFAFEFEADNENTMDSIVFATAYASEQRLRSKYKFPAPSRYFEHRQRDTWLINDLEDKLSKIAEKLKNDDCLIELNPLSAFGTEYVVSNYARRILSTYNTAYIDPELPVDAQQDIRNARYALNLCATIDAIKNGGSHATENGMVHTMILFYGMFDLVALLWSCIIKADRENSFSFGVTLADAVDALIEGISNGSRAKNRDKLADHTLYDDLETAKQCCDQGKYNFLIASMISILPEVEISYDCLEVFSIFLQNKILETLIETPGVGSLIIARQYLGYWLTGSSDELPSAYLKFVTRVNQNFDDFLIEFSSDLSGGINVDHFQSILNKIKTKIDEVNSLGFGSFIENVSPTHEALQSLWNLKHPQTGSDMKRARLALS